METRGCPHCNAKNVPENADRCPYCGGTIAIRRKKKELDTLEATKVLFVLLVGSALSWFTVPLVFFSDEQFSTEETGISYIFAGAAVLVWVYGSVHFWQKRKIAEGVVTSIIVVTYIVLTLWKFVL